MGIGKRYKKRRNQKNLSRSRGRMVNGIDNENIKKMIDENHHLFYLLAKRFGGLDSVRIESALPHKTRYKTSPLFKQKEEKRIRISVHTKNAKKTVIVHCNRHRGNDAKLSNEGFKFFPANNVWTKTF